MEELLLYSLCFFTVAFLYAAVGHGGASGYLALMALFGFSTAVMKPTALLLNLMVSLVAFISFFKAKHFKQSLLWPLILGSIPFTYLGSVIHITDLFYKQLLGVVLLIAVWRLLFTKAAEPEYTNAKWYWLSLAGALIGLVSGMIGMGGGILLSPLLLLMGWSGQKQTAAVTAIFIFLNSAVGMLVQFNKGFQLGSQIGVIIVFVGLGGIFGAYLGATRFRSIYMKYILSLVLVLAATKLFFVK